MHRDPVADLKRRLAAELVRLIEGWNPHDIAVRLGTDQPRISDLRRGKLDRFSLERLIRFVSALRCRVELNVVDLAPQLRTRSMTSRQGSDRHDGPRVRSES